MVGLLHARKNMMKKEAFLIDGNYYKIVGIVSTKINTLIKYQLLNGAIV